MASVNVEHLKDVMVCPTSRVLWTFGYASLIWKPGFDYSNRIVGYIKGYKRRFYQGTTTHRGTPEWPGRVATIIKDNHSKVWGVAYEVKKEDDIWRALIHLAEREMITGGYHFDKVKFYPKDADKSPIDMCVYVADPENVQYLGSGGSIEVQAYQIVKSVGMCGKNSEYVNKVVDFMKSEVDIDNWSRCDRYLWKLHKTITDIEMGALQPSERTLTIVPLQFRQVSEKNQCVRNENIPDLQRI